MMHSIWPLYKSHASLQWQLDPSCSHKNLCIVASPHGSAWLGHAGSQCLLGCACLELSYSRFICGVQLAADTGIKEVQKIQKLSASSLSYEL